MERKGEPASRSEPSSPVRKQQFLAQREVLPLAIFLRAPQTVVGTAQLLIAWVRLTQGFASLTPYEVPLAPAVSLYLACKLTAQRIEWQQVSTAWTQLHGGELSDYTDVTPLENKLFSCVEGQSSRLELPYQYVHDSIDGLDLATADRKAVLQVATNFATDSLCSPAFPRYSASTVAAACVWLAAQYLGLALDLPVHPACVERLIEVYTDPDK